MPADPPATADTHPRVSRYTRYATARAVTLANWHEEVIHLAALEACHITQVRARRPRSESRPKPTPTPAWPAGPPPSRRPGPAQAAATEDLHVVG